MRQPRASLEITTSRPKQDIRAGEGKLSIDQSRAFDAVGHGPFLTVMNRIYSQSKGIALQGIAKIVADGNRMAQITNPANAFAEIARNQAFDFFEFKIMGEASFDNVDVKYDAGPLEIETSEGSVNIETHPNRPEYNYYRGKLDIYLAQYPSVEIIPPRLDERM